MSEKSDKSIADMKKFERVKGSKGKVHYRKRVWYSWDDMWRESKTCKRLNLQVKIQTR